MALKSGGRLPLIILGGPTAVGKSEVSISLAEKIGAEIISADSVQVYRGMDIGSAKLSTEEMRGIPHHLIDVLSPDEPFDVTVFAQMAKQCVHDICSRGKLPVVVGGTGFYIQALLYDIDFTEHSADPEYRESLESAALLPGGKDTLYEMLQGTDPDAAAYIPRQNVRRVIRALEYYHLTGEKISVHNQNQRQKESPYRYAYFVLTDEREKIYARIERRVDRMIEDGLVKEVAALREQGYGRQYSSMKALGYKEILDYLDGELTLEEAASKIKLETRHFAKRQLTWFRREKNVIWIDRSEYEDEEKMTDEMVRILREEGIASEQYK